MSVGCATGVVHDSQPRWLQGLLRIKWSFCLKKLPACCLQCPPAISVVMSFHLRPQSLERHMWPPIKPPCPSVMANTYCRQAQQASATSQRLSPDTQVSVRCLWSSTTDGPKSADAEGSNPPSMWLC